jgi:hypothetical protein
VFHNNAQILYTDIRILFKIYPLSPVFVACPYMACNYHIAQNSCPLLLVVELAADHMGRA